MRGFSNPTWCLIACCLSQIEAGGKSGDNHSLVGIAALVPRNARGLPKNFTKAGGSSDTPSGSGFHNEPGGSGVSGMAHIRKSFVSRRISSEASAPLLASWRPKYSRTATPCFQNSLAVIHKGIEIPLWDL